MDLSALFLADLLGVFVFALSGALAAARKSMDIFGYVVLGLLPAVGGGTLRDVILDAPVFWTENSLYILVALSAAVLAYTFPLGVGRRLVFLKWADAAGLALFCVLGASKALDFGADVTVAVVMGLVTAVSGGLLRDVVSNEVPLILQREIYATAAIAGAIIYCVCMMFGLSDATALVVGGFCAFAIRAAGIYFGWSLPIRRG